MSSLRKYRNRILLGVTILLLVTGGGLLAIMHFYGDEVKQTLLAQLNDRLEVEVSVDEIQLDLFTNFPKGSLRLKGIQSREKGTAAGNSLLKAGEISLLFNLLDIFHGEYTIEKINLYDAFLNLVVFENGDVNYRLFKEDPSSGNTLSVNLNKVHFKNVVISYAHLPSQQEYLFRIDAGDLEGTFSSRIQQFHFNGLIQSTYIKSGNNIFLEDRLLSLNTEIAIDKDQSTIRFIKGEMRSEGLDFTLTGLVNTGDDRKHLSLAVLVDRSSIRDLIKLIPATYLEPIKDVTLNGDIEITANIEGNFTGNHIPVVMVDFAVDNGTFVHDKSGLKLNGLKFNGKFTNGKSAIEKTYHLSIINLVSSFDGGSIEGSIDIQDFSQPKIHTRLMSTARLENLGGIIRIDTIKNMNGLVELNLEFRNTLKDFRKFTIGDFISSQTTGGMKITGMNFTLKESPHEFRNFNGNFKFNNKDLKIDSFSGIVSGTDFQMEGYFNNILAYAFVSGEPIFINADFHSDHFNLDRILETGNTKSSQKARLSFSERVNYNLNIEIDTFTFRKFTSTENIGQLIQRNRTLFVKNTTINSMDGKVQINGSINGRDDELYTIDCKAEFMSVNIEKLFRDFGNFGQKNITSDHLRGTMDARVDYRSTLTPYLFVNQKSVFTLADVEITDGELIRYQPLYKLSRYVRQDELEHVRFSTLRNSIKIDNEVVFIPRMDIESSTMNLTLYGEHTFDNEIDYHVQLLLSELLSREQPAEEDLGDNFVEDDGLGNTRLFLTMTGSADDPVVKYDSKEVRNKIAGDLKKEGSELKKILRDEFGTGSRRSDQKQDEPVSNESKKSNFTIDWDETKDKNNKKSIPPAPLKDLPAAKKDTPSQQDFIIQWDETKDTIDKEKYRKNR